MPGLRRKICPTVVGRAARGEKGREGPAALTGHALDGAHVDRVEVGSFLPIDLDVHEVPIHEIGRRRVLERLPLHHVAPMARRVTDGKQNRSIFPPRTL